MAKNEWATRMARAGWTIKRKRRPKPLTEKERIKDRWLVQDRVTRNLGATFPTRQEALAALDYVRKYSDNPDMVRLVRIVPLAEGGYRIGFTDAL